jgi:hypothetical protein
MLSLDYMWLTDSAAVFTDKLQLLTENKVSIECLCIVLHCFKPSIYHEYDQKVEKGRKEIR